VQLLLDKGRIIEIALVRQEFSTLLDQKTGRVEAQLSSPIELAPAAQQRVQALLGKMLGKEVVLMARVDPALIGGLVVRIGNTVWDGSVANHLDRLRQQLIAE
jgi:F-type H+-transporting ATPase subunit delta